MIVFLWVMIANGINLFFVGKILDKDLGNITQFFAINAIPTFIIIAITYPIMLKVMRYIKVVVAATILNIAIIDALYITVLDFIWKDAMIMLITNCIIHFVVFLE